MGIGALCGIIIKTDNTTGFKSKTNRTEILDDFILKQQTTASRTHSYIAEWAQTGRVYLDTHPSIPV